MGASEVICDRPECFAYRSSAYAPRGAHIYVMYCAWGGPSCALHLMSSGLQVADRDAQIVLDRPLGWTDSVVLESTDSDRALVRVTFPGTGRWPLPVRAGRAGHAGHAEPEDRDSDAAEGRGTRAFTTALGPYPVAEATGLAEALRRLTSRSRAQPVAEAELAAHPHAFHGKLVSTAGTWNIALESCRFANAWSALPTPGIGERRARAVGLWLSDPRQVYGHMGLCRAQFIVLDATDEA